MKKLIYFVFILTLGIYNNVFAQCGEVGVDNFAMSQEQLASFSGCEIINGNLIISGTVDDLSDLSSLIVLNGSLYLLNTSVTDLSPLGNLNNAIQIQIQGNTSLSSCCEILQFNNLAQLGTVMNLVYADNGTSCSDANTIMMDCWGYIEGCTDSTALNYSELATQDDGSCEYFCAESMDDIIDYSCNGEAYPTTDCEIEIINKPSEGAGHYNNPIGLCYDQSPPSSGPHRPMWGRWGEYEYMPPQRYIHNLEHGGITFLYHPCVDPSIIDSLRTIACSRADDDGGAFRWVLSPYADLPTNIAVVAWEWSYTTNCFDAVSINEFIDEHYRNAPEDFYYNGSYDTLYIGKCEEYGCLDPIALNFDPTASLDNGLCEYPIIDTQLVSLNEGWNMFSTYIEPLNDSMLVIFDPIIENTIIVKNNNGEAMLPDWGMDIIHSKGQGYLAKMLAASELNVLGTQLLPEENPLMLEQGWNMIAYLRDTPADINLVMQDIESNIIIVKDELGNVYFPEWGFNNIGEMKPGKGYHLKMTAADVLLYISNDDEY